MVEARRLPQRIDGEGDAMANPAALDQGLAALAVEDVRHDDQGLQRVALLAMGRARIMAPARGPLGIVDQPGDAIVKELVDNAIDAAEERGDAPVVADQGPGIAPKIGRRGVPAATAA